MKKLIVRLWALILLLLLPILVPCLRYFFFTREKSSRSSLMLDYKDAFSNVIGMMKRGFL